MNIAGTRLEADLVRAALGPLFLVCLLVIVYLGKNKIGRLYGDRRPARGRRPRGGPRTGRAAPALTSNDSN